MNGFAMTPQQWASINEGWQQAKTAFDGDLEEWKGQIRALLAEWRDPGAEAIWREYEAKINEQATLANVNFGKVVGISGAMLQTYQDACTRARNCMAG
jgi:hypothetical protein